MGVNEEDVLKYLVPGRILYILYPFPHTVVAERKRMVFVGWSDNPLFLKINTDPNFGSHEARLREYAFRVRVDDYGEILDHDSHLDCGTTWYSLTVEEVMKQVLDNPQKCSDGVLSRAHQDEVINLTSKSKSIAPINKAAIRTLLKR